MEEVDKENKHKKGFFTCGGNIGSLAGPLLDAVLQPILKKILGERKRRRR